VSSPRCCKAVSMNVEPENGISRGSNPGPAPSSLARRSLDLARWVIPGAVLALLPKCPACIALYLAIGTGAGISMATASYVRMVLLGLSAASLFYLAARRVWGWLAARSVRNRRNCGSQTCASHRAIPAVRPT
jgi:hypothetical protein